MSRNYTKRKAFRLYLFCEKLRQACNQKLSTEGEFFNRRGQNIRLLPKIVFSF